MNNARAAMFERGDSLAARQSLLESIRFGIGRPEGHAALGHLLKARGSRFGVLELKVAAELDRRDWRSRRALLDGLVDARLDAQANRVFSELQLIYPEWQQDSLITHAVQVLHSRDANSDVAAFNRENR